MSSAILYKFQAATTFEALPLPGTSARLFDVKRAIVKTKRLDSSSTVEFDLSVRNAATNEEYADEQMLLPRGTRLIVRRLPAARGHGFLERMARAEAGVGGAGRGRGGAPPSAVPSDFYTIQSRGNAEEDEFVSAQPTTKTEDERELAALMAATAHSTTTSLSSGAAGGMGGRGGGGGYRPAGSGPPPSHHQRGFRSHQQHGGGHYRPNADPELREQEKQMQPKKHAIGIPRTFLSLNSPPVTTATDGEGGEEQHHQRTIQPNALGFEELVNRGGGQAADATGTKRDLEYALNLTATTIPEHLQCAICQSVAKDAMMIPWDPEGRTTCETCIRDALAQSGFQCPLTGTEGVSPDELLPNRALRKAVDHFIKGVMEKVEQIDQQQGDEDDEKDVYDAAAAATMLEGDASEKGVIVSRRSIAKEGRSKKNDHDPFGLSNLGDDDFGGDVFAVGNENKDDDDKEEEEEKEGECKVTTENTNSDAQNGDNKVTDLKSETLKPADEEEKEDQTPSATLSSNPMPSNTTSKQGKVITAEARREARMHRSLPAGYTMGPAGVAGSAVRGRKSSQRTTENSSRTTNQHDEEKRRPNYEDRYARHHHRGGGAGGSTRRYDQQTDSSSPSGDGGPPHKRPRIDGRDFDQHNKHSSPQQHQRGPAHEYGRGGRFNSYRGGYRGRGRGRGGYRGGGRGYRGRY